MWLKQLQSHSEECRRLYLAQLFLKSRSLSTIGKNMFWALFWKQDVEKFPPPHGNNFMVKICAPIIAALGCVARYADLSVHVRILKIFRTQCRNLCGIVRIFNKKSQFLVISAKMLISKEIFISMLNTWTDLNSYILHVLMSYCRRSDYVTSEVLARLVSRSRM